MQPFLLYYLKICDTILNIKNMRGKFMNYNYHTHTFRCNHATGTEEEYIKTAIKGGIKYMGFSDHAPFKLPCGYESLYRVPQALAKDYIDTVSELREKYKQQIDIKIGFEMEYYPDYFETMLKNVIDFGAEYLILGQHFVNDEYPNGISSSSAKAEEHLIAYANLVIEGIKTGCFTYVCHPDVIGFNGEDSVYEREMRRICVASREYNIPLEINFLGIRFSRHYPNEKLWKIAGEEKCPVTFGFDAHATEEAYDGDSIKPALELVKKYNLNYIGMPKIIDIRKK